MANQSPVGRHPREAERPFRRKLPPLVLVLLGGFIAGALDIVFAIAFWFLKADVPPLRILQSVAAGLLGRSAFAGGSSTAALGLALHFFIALCMSGAYYASATWWPPLHLRPWVCGLVCGLGLYLVMNLIVVPLSAAMPGSRDPLWIALSVIVHMLLIGVPIALSTQAAMRARFTR
jgi:hypothetical protein